MCDYGRTIYKSVHAANRLTVPQVKYKNNLVPVSWKEAFSFAAGRLRKYAGDQIGWIISPSATNEECFVFLKLIKNIFHSDHVVAVTSYWNNDDLLIKPEKAANTFGLRKAGIEIYKNLQQSGTNGLINEGGLSALYIIGNEITEIQDFYHETLRIMTKLEFLIVQSTHDSELSEIADVVFPSACFAEKAGSFLNTESITQHFDRAIPPPGQAKPDLEIANTLAGFLGIQLS
jgi:predicted molibdopterin-dependent oxidoreductase YjgC